MSSRVAAARLDPRIVALAVAVPVLAGLVAVVDGYPIPRRLPAIAGVLGGALFLGSIGGLGAWSYDRGFRVAPTGLGLGILTVFAWALVAPGVTAARVGDDVVLAGRLVLSRFVGASPLLLLAEAGVALVESDLAATDDDPSQSPGVTVRGVAIRRGLAGGVVVGTLSLLPGVLLGDPLASVPLAGFAAAGGVVGGGVLVYLLVRHGLRTPVLVLALVGAVAALAVTDGGSPHGFPLSWPVWLAAAVAIGGLEAAVRRLLRT